MKPERQRLVLPPRGPGPIDGLNAPQLNGTTLYTNQLSNSGTSPRQADHLAAIGSRKFSVSGTYGRVRGAGFPAPL